jgi:hypothetical protein
MKRTSLCFAAALFIAGASQAAVPSGQKCANLSEVALLARALAEEKVDKSQAHAIVRRMYSVGDAQSRSFARLVIESAYSATASAGEFAQKFEVVCIASSGEPGPAKAGGSRDARLRM